MISYTETGEKRVRWSTGREVQADGTRSGVEYGLVADRLQDRTRSRSLTIVDVYTPEAVAIGVGQSLKGDDMVRTLNRVKFGGGLPKALFCDNSCEFTNQTMDLHPSRRTLYARRRHMLGDVRSANPSAGRGAGRIRKTWP